MNKNNTKQVGHTNIANAIVRVFLAVTLVLGLMPSLATTSEASANEEGNSSGSYTSLKANEGESMNVKFDTNGGTPSTIEAVAEWNDDDFTWYLSAPTQTITKEGFELSGWKATNISGVETTFEANFKDEELSNFDEDSTGYVVFTAQWKEKATAKCTVTFNANGGKFADNGLTKEVEVTKGEKVSKITETPTKDESDFTWWSTKENDDPTNKSEFDFENTKIESDTVIYAQWYAWEKYTVTYDLNGHGTTKPNDEILIMKYADDHVYATKPSVDPTSNDGYSFCCWNLKDPESGALTKWDFDDHDSFYVDDDTVIDENNTLTLYAKWYATTYEITYGNVDGATNTNETKYTVESEDITLAAPTKEGKTFVGWFEKDGRTTGDWGAQVTKIAKGSLGNKTLYAKWEGDEVYTVKFNTNGGSSVASQTVATGEKATKPADPTKNGYEFSGWYSDSKCTKAFNFSTAIKANTTLYAKWTAKTNGTPNSEGKVYVVDPTNARCLSITLVDANNKPVKNVTVSIDAKGAITVKLGTSFIDLKTSKISLKQTVSNTDGTLVKNKAVTIKKADGTTVGTGKTDAKGEYSILLLDSTRVKMYRLYNPYTGEHFYTADASEQKNLVKVGWNDEGTGWYAPKKTTVPVYRLYNKYALGGDHHYTMNADERDTLVKAGWSYEGEAWYSCEDADSAKQVLYRQYNPNAQTGTHNYTLDKKEAKNVVAAGWNDEGTAWYGYANEK